MNKALGLDFPPVRPVLCDGKLFGPRLALRWNEDKKVTVEGKNVVIQGFYYRQYVGHTIGKNSAMEADENGHATLLEETENDVALTESSTLPMEPKWDLLRAFDLHKLKSFKDEVLRKYRKWQMIVAALLVLLLARVAVMLCGDLADLAEYMITARDSSSLANKTQGKLSLKLSVNIPASMAIEIQTETLPGQTTPLIAEIRADVRMPGRAADQTWKSDPTFCTRGMAVEWNLTQSLIITPELGESPYLCDVRTDGGGWIVIQRREKGDITFNRPWKDFKNGFGPLTGDFWLGNERVHQFTKQGTWELLVEFRHKDHLHVARYTSFRLAHESNKYRLHLGGFSTNDGLRDELQGLDGAQFVTPDRETDVNCAVKLSAAWWYPTDHSDSDTARCGAAGNLNLPWRHREAAFWRSTTAYSGFVSGYAYSRSSSGGGEDVDMTQMKIRRLL
ncbi:fibrinogen-related protein 3.1 [Plakobranchus ocellatus]|uniref:Fibrinogen-related protein 3.1 n=1 Tax=Plakobranchus ocellatus TaxID=259542 RepID=A0AAV4DEF7_9GAST|nr:fibrinogen-related protein 3.1 [Plakobranchus ocellatus]